MEITRDFINVIVFWGVKHKYSTILEKKNELTKTKKLFNCKFNK